MVLTVRPDLPFSNGPIDSTVEIIGGRRTVKLRSERLTLGLIRSSPLTYRGAYLPKGREKEELYVSLTILQTS